MPRPSPLFPIAGCWLVLFVACGGGGGSGGAALAPQPDPLPPPGSQAARAEASRFLAQATFGGQFAEISALAASGDYAAWIDAQRARPVTRLSTALAALDARFDVGDRTRTELDAAGIPYIDEEGEPESVVDDVYFARFAWWSTILDAPDQLRQRVAYALSQLLVVSDLPEATSGGEVIAAWYDLLQRHALGSYRELLEDISYSTGMGLYLTHMGNDKGDPARGVFPDENFARELMQLFTIGLWELNEDGTRRLGEDGRPIPTYDNDDITELAKVFTGLGPNEGNVFRATELEEIHDPARPMAIWESHHAPGPKRLIDGSTTDAGTAGDIDAALDALVAHPNTGPFVGRFLIRRLVTSNPSPAYVRRVARVFADNGQGIRGDLGAVVRAILLDPEARGTPLPSTSGGKLREPAMRYVHLLRAFDARTPSGLFLVLGSRLQDKDDVPEMVEAAQLGQHPLSAPSVFNFYRDDHQPATLRGTSLVSPESQIIHATSVSAWNSLLRQVLLDGHLTESHLLDRLAEEAARFDPAPYRAAFGDLARYVGWSATPAQLVAELDLLLAAGALSDATCKDLVDVLADPRAASLGAEQRVRFAIYLVMLAPEYLHRN